MQWTRIPSGGWGSRNTPSYATETGMTANLKGHLAYMQTLLPLRSCFLPWPLFRTNAHTKHFTWKWIDFQENEPTGDVHFHTNSFAERLILPQRQKSTIHPWAAQRAFDLTAFAFRRKIRFFKACKRELIKSWVQKDSVRQISYLMSV